MSKIARRARDATAVHASVCGASCMHIKESDALATGSDLHEVLLCTSLLSRLAQDVAELVSEAGCKMSGEGRCLTDPPPYLLKGMGEAWIRRHACDQMKPCCRRLRGWMPLAQPYLLLGVCGAQVVRLINDDHAPRQAGHTGGRAQASARCASGSCKRRGACAHGEEH